MNNWISVKDRMVPYDEDVIMTDGEKVVVASLYKVGNEDRCGPPSFIPTDGAWLNFDYAELTHWMPLPEPPK